MASLGNTGTVRNWFDHKGYGFIVPDQNGSDGYPLPDIFVHRHALIGVQSLVPGSAVRYRQGWNARKNVLKLMRSKSAPSPFCNQLQSLIPIIGSTSHLHHLSKARGCIQTVGSGHHGAGIHATTIRNGGILPALPCIFN